MRVRFFVVLCVYVFFCGFLVVAVFIKPPLVVSCYCLTFIVNKLFP